MCTAINQTQGYHLFGRTLDLEKHFKEQIVITPSTYLINYPNTPPGPSNFCIMGVAHVSQGIPLYYDAVNSQELCMAALHFPHYAKYHKPQTGKQNIPSYALIPWILRQCPDIDTALEYLQNINITADAFSPNFPPTPLHWLLSDKHTSYVIESTTEGLQIHPNSLHVMTNAPTFPMHTNHLSNYMHISPAPPINHICPAFDLSPCSRGMGSVGLPGDMSSMGRFVRAVYVHTHTLPEHTLDTAVHRFFHVIESVSQSKGCNLTSQGEPVYTVYTSCADPQNMCYYVTTYEHHNIQKFQATSLQIQSNRLFCFDFL